MQAEIRISVTLVLEGTYPFVRGGVSTWVHELITGLPEIVFDLVYLGAEAPAQPVQHYVLPPNVRALQCHYLMDDGPATTPQVRDGDPAMFAASACLHDWFRNPCGQPDSAWLGTVLGQGGNSDQDHAADFFHSRQAWTQICESYERYCPNDSFNSYFWAVRSMHAPLLKLGKIAASITPGAVVHSVSTGYAGLLASLLARSPQHRLMLTEHGIYTKERKIELQALLLPNVPEVVDPLAGSGADPMPHRDQIWLRLFEGIGRLVYASADPIISLYEANRQRQIADGAERSRTRVIPNGVDVARFAPLRAQRPSQVPMVLGLIGRIVPIKDVKTFIRAIAVLVAKAPDIEGWLIGPEEEDRGYVDDCRALVTSLGLEANVRFLGFRQVEQVLPQLGLLVLSSISEAFPLVIGESLASGLPVLATDVGACRELIEGGTAADRALGAAGAVVPIADHEALAHAALALLQDRPRWDAAQRAGILRVEAYYAQSRVIDSYRSLYQSLGAT
jgi:glycosyltransferase involved in cell wall biosynthesis